MSDFKRIDPHTASQLLDNDAQLVDIRDPQSFDFGHIPGAIRLDNDNLADFVANANQQAPLIVCCYHGNSSQGAAAYLVGQGFSDVYSLDGGFELWRATYPDETAQSVEE